MADQWYYARNNQKHGPLTGQQLKKAAVNGQLHPTDMVWKEGMQKWIPASSVKGLFQPAQPAAAVPPRTAVARPPRNESHPTAQIGEASAYGRKSPRRSSRKAAWLIAAGGAGVCIIGVVILVFALSGKGAKNGPSGNPSSADSLKRSPMPSQSSDAPKLSLQEVADPKTWDLAGSFVFQARRSFADGIALSPDGRTLLVQADGYPPQLYDLHTGQRRGIMPELHDESKPFPFRRSPQFSPSGSHIVFWNSQKIALWNVKQGRIERELDAKALDLQKGEAVYSLRFASSTKLLASIHTSILRNEPRVILWEFPSFSKCWDVPGQGSICVADNAATFACLAPRRASSMVVIHNLDNGAEVSRIEAPKGFKFSNPSALALSADARALAVFYHGSDILIYDLPSKSLKSAFLRNRGLPKGAAIPAPTTMAMSSNGKYIAIGDKSGFACLWDVTQDSVTPLLGHRDVVQGAVFSPKGGVLVTTAGDRTVKLWQGMAGEQGKLRPMEWSANVIQNSRQMWHVHPWGLESPGSPDPKRAVTVKDVTLYFPEEEHRKTGQKIANALAADSSLPVKRIYIGNEGNAFRMYIGFGEGQRKDRSLCKQVVIRAQTIWHRAFNTAQLGLAATHVAKISVCDENLTTTYASIPALNDLSDTSLSPLWQTWEANWRD